MPFPSPGDLPDPVIEPESPELAGGFFTTEPLGKPNIAVQLPRGKVLMKKGKLGLPLTLATLAKEQSLQILSFLQDGASVAAAVFQRLWGAAQKDMGGWRGIPEPTLSPPLVFVFVFF